VFTAPAPVHRPSRPDDPRHGPALALAGQGVAVFVLGRRKRPVANCPTCRDALAADTGHDRQGCGCLTCHGFYAATTDPDRIADILAAVPSGLLAIRTGAVSGRVVVDIDPRHGGRLDPTVMTPTATVATGGADHGWHLHYRHPGGYVPSRELPGHPGIDIKGDGGYVVVPPAVHPLTRRAYAWVGARPVDVMPPPLVTACLADAADAPSCPVPTTPGARHATRAGLAGGGGISSPDALLSAHLAAVARAVEGKRRTTLYGAARGTARIVLAGALDHQTAWDALYAAGREAGQTDRETRAAITGGFTAEGLTR